MAAIPEHVVVQEILERAYAGLPIDTRLHFKLAPRRLGWGQAHAAVSQHLEERLESAWPDGDVLASAHTLVESRGRRGGEKFDQAALSLSIHRDEAGDPFYSVRKQWLLKAGRTRTLSSTSRARITERAVAEQIEFYDLRGGLTHRVEVRYENGRRVKAV